MPLTEDSFRALARSSPWRFSALHFTRRAPATPFGTVEAWLRRPGWLRVVEQDGTEWIETGVPYSSTTFTLTGTGVVESAPVDDPEPSFRPDGLVARRPDDWPFRHADPMFENYRWVAMLDPAELAEGVVLSRLAEDDLFGRPVWRARAVAAEGYDPLCACCPLLWSKVSDDLEYGADRPPTTERYPEAYDVALDVQTGVVVSLRPVGGSREDWFEVEIHDAE